MILSQLFPPDVAIGGIDIDGEYASDQLDEWYRRVDRSGVRLNLIGSFEHYHRDPVNIRDVKNVYDEDNTRLGAWRALHASSLY